MILESMKMEINMTAPEAGIVAEVRVQPGSPVRAGQWCWSWKTRKRRPHDPFLRPAHRCPTTAYRDGRLSPRTVIGRLRESATLNPQYRLLHPS
jgi:hypothetical protein